MLSPKVVEMLAPEILDTFLDSVMLVGLNRFMDQRGHFAETFRAEWFANLLPGRTFVQDSESYNAVKGILRGLHYQKESGQQLQIVRVVRGAIFDVTVDLRPRSPTFGRHRAYELSSESCTLLVVPEGFGHGFCTLCDDTLVLYKASGYYRQEFDAGVRWNDPEMGINWPVEHPLISTKDNELPLLAELKV